MEMTRKVFKYGTGDEIPEGAIYLSTQVEPTVTTYPDIHTGRTEQVTRNILVWHYFLVELKD